MKNRRITLVAFLLVATLVMGLGYAAITGSLTIGGTAIYNPASVLQSQSDVYFRSAEAGTNCTVTHGRHDATMTVTFNDLDPAETATQYTATATFSIAYTVDLQATDSSSFPNAQITPVITQPSNTAFVTSVQTSIAGVDQGSGAFTMAPDGTATVTVTVTYTVPAEIPTASQEADINIALNYEFV